MLRDEHATALAILALMGRDEDDEDAVVGAIIVAKIAGALIQKG